MSKVNLLLSKIFREVLLKQKITPLITIRCVTGEVQDKVTHTGQKWDPSDYRLARFVDRPKHVNPNFAIDLIAEVPPIASKERVVWCDGGSGPTGHPKVYINLDKPGEHACGYCGLRYYLDHKH